MPKGDSMSDPPVIEEDGLTTSKMATCYHCRFFHHGEEECRRKSPSHDLAARIGEMETTSTGYWWPQVSVNDWCGDFERGVKLARQSMAEQEAG